MRGKRVPDQQRATAVGLALVKGVPAASKATGIPQRSLRRWKQDPELAELGLSAREDVAQTMWVAIQQGLDEVYAALRSPNEGLKAKADALFGLMQQYSLMTGQATSRTETKDITLDDHEAEIFGEVVRAELARRANEHAAESAVEGAAETGAEATAG